VAINSFVAKITVKCHKATVSAEIRWFDRQTIWEFSLTFHSNNGSILHRFRDTDLLVKYGVFLHIYLTCFNVLKGSRWNFATW